MRILIAIMFGIGFFAVAGLALQIVIGLLLALYEIPKSIIMKSRQKKRAKIALGLAKEALDLTNGMISQLNNIKKSTEQKNCDKAYKDGVKKVSKSKK